MVKTYAEDAGEQAYSCLSGEGTLLMRNPSEVSKKEVPFPLTILLLSLSSFQECWPCLSSQPGPFAKPQSNTDSST